MKIIKRNGAEETFNALKIENAISKANLATDEKPELIPEEIHAIAAVIQNYCEENPRPLSVEEIQELVETQLMKYGAYETAKRYIRYRYTRGIVRASNTTDDKILTLMESSREDFDQEPASSLAINSIQRDYMAGEISKDLTERVLLPEDIVRAHHDGVLYFHDSAYYAQHMHNATLIDLQNMLQNGTMISGTLIEKPHSFSTACNIATQIIAQVASNQYGDQAMSLSHLAPFVKVSRDHITRDTLEELRLLNVIPDEETLKTIVEKRLHKEMRRGIQTLQYQVNTLMTTSGKGPSITFLLYLGEAKDPEEKHDLALMIEEMLTERLEGLKNEDGVFVSPTFPRLIYVLEEENTAKNSPYWYLTELSFRCTLKRMSPDYVSEKKLKEYFPFPGGPLQYGLFSQGMVTLNLADAALSFSGENDDPNDFFFHLNARLELCHRALIEKHKRLLGTLSDAAPILWQHGAIARFEKDEPIDSLLFGDHSTLSLAYAGLSEAVYALTGSSILEDTGKAFGLKILEALNDILERWQKEDNIHYVLNAAPPEHTVYTFAKRLQKKYGILPGVTDKNTLTNPLRRFAKEDKKERQSLDNEFEKQSPYGSLTTVELNNTDAADAEEWMQHLYETTLYATIRVNSDFCKVCGYTGQMNVITDEDGRLVYECPHCHNRDESKMTIVNHLGL